MTSSLRRRVTGASSSRMPPNDKSAPDRWLTLTMSQLGEWTGGATPKKNNPRYWSDGTIPWVSPKDVKVDHINTTIDYITAEALDTTSAKIVPTDSLLFVTRSGILKHSLPVSSNTVPVAINQDIKALTFYEGLLPDFFRYQVNARAKEMLRAIVKTGVTVESVDFSALKQFPMFVPSVEEQRDVARELDTLTYLLNEAQASLEKSRKLLATLLATALGEAFDGSFVSRTSWPTVHLNDLLFRVVAGKSLKCRERPPTASERGVIKVSAVTWGEFNALESKTLPDNYEPNPETQVRSGDLLFSRANTRELVGACVIVDDAPDNLYLSDKILRLELNDAGLKRWVHWYLRSPQGRAQLESMAHGGQASMLNIPQRSLQRCSIPMPDIQTRERTLDAVERARDLARASMSDVERAKGRVRYLQQAVLELAFTGALTPSKTYPPAGEVVISVRTPAPSQAKKVRAKTGRSSDLENELSDNILSAITASGPAGLTFSELRAVIPSADYDTLQEIIFELLSAKKPGITQVFDKVSGHLRLVGVAR